MMNKKSACHGFMLAMSICCATFLGLSPAMAQERITSDVRVTAHGKLTNKERRAVSQAAGRILIHVSHARLELRVKREKEAMAQIEKALLLTRIIENIVPQYQIKSIIKSGDLTYEDEETIRPLTVPIYPELDETASLIMSIKKSKKEAASSSESSSNSGEAQLQYTTVSLDVREAKYYLNEALAALKKNDAAGADKALLSIQDEVTFDFEEIDVPLVKARWHLVDAAKKVTRAEYKEAKEALRKAAGAVETYITQMGEGLSSKEGIPAQIQGLADDINGLAAKLEEKKDKASDIIGSLWYRLTEQ